MMKPKLVLQMVCIFIFSIGLAACSVVSKNVRQEAISNVTFKALTAQTDQYSELHLWDEPKYPYHYYDPHYPWTDNYYHFWWHYPYRW